MYVCGRGVINFLGGRGLISLGVKKPDLWGRAEKMLGLLFGCGCAQNIKASL